ncbi:MAG: RagB/SusD family nutrient uptake outer membrane protein, partial [Tannerellaceae bacterium]|nr:RagB/SusD family nutrient uptake outer membrane protein [Tannerellaceae bacterium]
MLSVACSDEMNYNEFVSYNNEQVFSSFNRTMEFVTGIYSYIDVDLGSDYGGAMLASASDEAEYVWTASSIHEFYNGGWSAANPKAVRWSSSYEGIRAANYFLQASHGRTFSDFKYNRDYNDQMGRFERYQYEVRFLR